jgi:hypothetical protein
MLLAKSLEIKHPKAVCILLRNTKLIISAYVANNNIFKENKLR